MALSANSRQLLLQVDASTELARRALDALDRDIGRNVSSIDRSLGRIDQAMGRVAVAAGAFLSIRGLSSLGQQFLGIADQSKQMQAQLQLATAQFGSFGQAQQDAERIATVTRNGLSETTTLYGNFLRASQGLGRSQADAARATETFSKALKLGGADAASAASATLQFGQALASGVLRGDEFNSIAEASPRILRLLADALGVSTGALRGMAAEGKLSADVLYNALTDRKFTAGIDAEFQQLPKTFDEAMVLVENAAVTTFGAFDRGGEFSTAIANFVTDGAGGFADLSKRAEDFGINVRAVMDGMASVFDPLLNAGNAAFDLLGIKAEGLGGKIRKYVSWNLHNSQDLLNGLTGPFYSAGYQAFDFADRFDQVSSQSLRERQAEANYRRLSASPPDWAQSSINSLNMVGGVIGTSRSATNGTSGRRAIGRTRRPTDADLTPMQLILRDIGSQELPMGIADALWNPPGLVDAKHNLDELEKGLASIDGISQQIDIGAILKQEDQDRLEQFSHYFSEDLAAGIAGAVVYADSLGDALENSFKRAAAALLQSGIMELISPGSSGGSLFRGFLSNAAGLFGGFRASGGPVSPGRAYVVGERRPELFVPNVPGMIVPSADMMGAAGTSSHVTQHFSINAQGAVLAQGLIAEMQAIGVRAAGGGAVIAEQRANQRARNTLR